MADEKNRGAEILELLTKAVVPGSILLYIVGFVVAVPHYVRLGVPVQALPSTTFIAAGLCVATVTFIVAVVTESVRRKLLDPPDSPHPARRLAALALAAAAMAWIYAYLGPPTLVFALLFAVVTLMYGSSLRSYTEEDWKRPVSLLSLFGGGLIPVLGAFTALAYPSIPAHFAGGQPTHIRAVRIDAPDALDEGERWALKLCRTGVQDGRDWKERKEEQLAEQEARTRRVEELHAKFEAEARDVQAAIAEHQKNPPSRDELAKTAQKVDVLSELNEKARAEVRQSQALLDDLKRERAILEIDSEALAEEARAAGVAERPSRPPSNAEPRMPPEKVCRHIYEIHEDGTYLYLAVRDVPGACPVLSRQPPPLREGIFFDELQTCLTRVSKDAVPIMWLTNRYLPYVTSKPQSPPEAAPR